MGKWFSFNQKTQRTEEVVPSEELFNTSQLLFWSRGMDEWQYGPKALEFFLRPVEPIVAPVPVIPVVEEKKQRMGPFYKTEPTAPVVEKPVKQVVTEEIVKTGPIKKISKKRKSKSVSKKKTPKKISKHITVATKKQRKKAVKLKKKNRRKK